MSEVSLGAQDPDQTLAGKLPKDPVIRRTVKLGLDLLATCAAMAAACAVLRQGVPRWPGLAWFALLAMAVNAAFRLCAQHYRAVGIKDAWSIMLGNLTVAAGVVLVCILRGTGWPGGERPAVVLGASLLLGPLWFGLRLAVRTLHRRRAARVAPGLAQRTLIVGAGRAGILLSQELRDHPGMGGRVLGFVVKTGLGGAMVAITARAVWPAARPVVAMLGF